MPILHGEAGEEGEERRGAVADKEMQRDDGTAGHPVQLPGVGKWISLRKFRNALNAKYCKIIDRMYFEIRKLLNLLAK